MNISDFDECSSFPCQNGGTCINLIGDFNCDCQDEYYGDTCEGGRLPAEGPESTKRKKTVVCQI